MPIRALKIERYRGLAAFNWRPRPGLNCIIGPGDVGKSTVLAAIDLLLSPRRNPTITEFDYRARDLGAGFAITAVLGEVEEVASDMRVPALRGWLDGKLRSLPDVDNAEPVLVVSVRGGPDLDVEHVVIGPDGEEVPFPPGMRAKLLSARLLSSEYGASDLRLGRFSLLRDHTRDVDLTGLLLAALGGASAAIAQDASAAASVKALRERFREAGLPSSLHFGVVSPRSDALHALVALLHGEDHASAVPIANAGTGTRRLALLTLAGALLGDVRTVVLDEPEVGLEPYRQRHLLNQIRKLLKPQSQVFMTTHSPAILSVLHSEELACMRPDGIVPLPENKGVQRLLNSDAEIFLARLPVLCEGETEAGFFDVLLPHYAASEQLASDTDALGARISARTGQPAVLEEAEGLAEAGIRHALFVDAEKEFVGRRAALGARATCLLGTWTGGHRNIEEMLAAYLTLADADAVLELAAELAGKDARSFRQQVAERAEVPGDFSSQELVEKVGDAKFRRAFGEAMQDKTWFKKRSAGQRLATRLIQLGIPAKIEADLRVFWSKLRPLFEPAS